MQATMVASVSSVMPHEADQRTWPNFSASGIAGPSGRGEPPRVPYNAPRTHVLSSRYKGRSVELIRLLVLCLLAAIVASLGTALYHPSHGKGHSRRMLRALTVRIALSLALFALLMLAWWAGLITPRGFQH